MFTKMKKVLRALACLYTPVKCSPKTILAVFIVGLSSITSMSAVAQTETLSSGAYVINMGVVPQTPLNGLKPYGLVYDLLKNYNVPIKWVISSTKVKDGADFNYNGVDYKGGTFIIPSEFRNATVNGRIAFFGVTGITTITPLTVNVTYTLLSAPSWTLDVQNGKIAANFFSAAGIPNSAYNYKTPAELTGCDDIYVMPHADPTWTYHGPLYNWMLNTKGSFWGGCRTGSGIENLYNPLNTSQQLNFLSNNVSTAGTALIPYTSHAAGTPPYTHQFFNSPAAQYIGVTDGAQQNGSEQIYLPVLNGSWRSSTQIIAYDPSQQNVPTLSPGPAAAIAFGRAFGNSNLGFVMYEAGHDISGSSADQVAAQRAFFSFSFRVSVEKVPVINSVAIPAVFNSGNPQNVSVSAASQNGQTLSYEWISSCGGTFSNPAAASTSFTPPVVTSVTTCSITIKITDACGRNTFQTAQVKILPPSTIPDFNSTFVNVAVPGNVNTNDNVPAGTTYGTSPALVSSPTGSTPVLTMNSNGTYSFTANTPGVYTYDVPVCVPGQLAPCPNTKLVITVLNANSNSNAPVANVDIATTKFNTAVTLRTLANDAAGNLGTSLVPSSVTVTSAPKNGTTSINTTTGDITYTPAAGFSGRDTLTYQVCDNQSPAKCATAVQIITVNAAGTPNSTTAADDYKITPINTAATGNVKTNDSDAEGNIQTVTAQTTTIAGKGTLVLAADGNYTFTPVTGFTGPVDFAYTTCDNGTPQACASATLHILVQPTPDLTPRINLNPNNLIGRSSLEITVQINELNNVTTNGSPITLYVDKQSLFSSFTFSSTQTTNIAGQPVQNSLFSIDAVSNPDFYVITTNAVFANSLRRVTFSVIVNPGQTKGTTPLNVYLQNSSGGETNFTNNSNFTVLTFSF